MNTHPDPHPSEQQLEDLYVDWLAARDAAVDLDPESWIDDHVPLEMRTPIRELIEVVEPRLPVADDLVSGTVVGEDFELITPIGQGGFGSVWLAHQRSLDRRVALKLLHRDQLGHQEPADVVEREGRGLAALRHPAIATVYSVGRDGERLYLAMELIEGRPLSEILVAARARREMRNEPSTDTLGLGTPAGDRRAARIMREIGEAVGALHDLEVYHRDLKPANVLIDSQGQAKLVDFGLALRPEDAAPDSGTRFIGTADYLPPEELRERRRGQPDREDLWALGAMLYELVTLERPYGSGRSDDIVRRGSRGDIEPVAHHRPHLNRQLAAIVSKGLAPIPSARYADPFDLAEDLRRFLEHRPVRALRANARTRLKLVLQRHSRVLSILAVSVILIGFAVWAGGLLQGPRALAEVSFELVEPEKIPDAVRRLLEKGLRDSADTFERLAAIRRLEGRKLGVEESTPRNIARGTWFSLRVDARKKVWAYVFNRGSSGRIWCSFPRPQTQDLHNPLPPESSEIVLGSLSGDPDRVETDSFFVAITPIESKRLEDVVGQLLGDESGHSSPITQATRSAEITEAIRGIPQDRDVRPLATETSPTVAKGRAPDWIWTAPLEEIRRELGKDVYRWSFRHGPEGD